MFSEEDVLDTTLLKPAEKQQVIVSRFDELKGDETLTIYTNGDPQSLYQLLLDRGNIFSWQYVKEGADCWKVNITKRIAGNNYETLGQIAAGDIRKATVLKKYGLDFCCGGKKTIVEACAGKELDIAEIENELALVSKMPHDRSMACNEWRLDFLADYIVNTHHNYVRKMLPEIGSYAAKVAKVHGDQHPELRAIWKLTQEIAAEMSAHMAKEEGVLFPYIKSLVTAMNNTSGVQVPHFRTIQNPITVMEAEHELVGKHLEEIRRLSNNYQLPADACASYTVFFKMLAEFEDDLHMHVHLENNILFPKALKMEEGIRGNMH